MPFVSLEYIFMLVVLSAFNAFTSSNKWQKILLSCASIYYFAYWDIRFLILLLSYVAIAKVTELLMNNDSKLKKNIVCAMGIACCVLILATFKYANFFISSFGIVYGGSANKLVINLILPLGISFYTFQCISYIVDIYRDPAGKMPFIDLFLYIVFFPKLLAGPIMITADFKKQMENVRKPKFEDYFYGIQLFIYGMFKKIILADSLSDFISRCHEDYAVYSGVTLWVCALAYSVQIYCDFSGYSDMAIGSARILGVKIPPNFNWPYLSKNISIFWRNWHISLSSWLRDYIYIPLGGNRKGEFRTVLNKLITMLIGGLWHGANWTFVFWGALHGMLLIIHKLFTDIRIHTYIHTCE